MDYNNNLYGNGPLGPLHEYGHPPAEDNEGPGNNAGTSNERPFHQSNDQANLYAPAVGPTDYYSEVVAPAAGPTSYGPLGSQQWLPAPPYLGEYAAPPAPSMYTATHFGNVHNATAYAHGVTNVAPPQSAYAPNSTPNSSFLYPPQHGPGWAAPLEQPAFQPGFQGEQANFYGNDQANLYGNDQTQLQLYHNPITFTDPSPASSAPERPYRYVGYQAEMQVLNAPWAPQDPLRPGLNSTGNTPEDIANQLAVLSMADQLPKMASAKGAGLGLGGAIVPTIGRTLCIGEMYEGCVDSLKGMYWVRYESKLGIAGAGAAGFGFASAGVGLSLSASYSKTTILHMLVPLREARVIAANQANTMGRYLEAIHLRDVGIRTPDFLWPEALQLGDTRSTTSDMSGCFGVVMSTTGQRAGAYCSVDGQFTMHVSKADHNTMLLAFSPVKTVKVGMMVGGLLDQADISRSHSKATRFILAWNIHNPQGRQTYERAIREGKPPNFRFDPSVTLVHKDTLAATFALCFAACGMQLLEVELVDQVVKRGGAGLLTSSTMQKLERFFPMATGFSAASISDHRTRIVDGATTFVSDTQGKERQIALGYLGNSTSLVYVNAMYSRTGDHGPMQFVGLILGVQYRLAGSGLFFSNSMIKKLNEHFRLDLPEFEKTAARRDCQVRITQSLTRADIKRLTEPADCVFDLDGAAADKNKRVLAIVAQLKELEAQATSEPGFEALNTNMGPYNPGALAEFIREESNAEAASILADGIRDIETMAAVCRRSDPSGTKLKFQISCDGYEKALLDVRDLDLRYGASPISHTDRIADVTNRFELVAKARKKILEAFDLLQANGIMKKLKPDERDECEIKLALAWLILAKLIAFEQVDEDGKIKVDTTPLQQLAIVRQEKIFKSMTPGMQAGALHLIQSMGRTIKDPVKTVAAVQKALVEERVKLGKYHLPKAIRHAALEKIKAAELMLTKINIRTQKHDITKVTATEVKSFTELFGCTPRPNHISLLPQQVEQSPWPQTSASTSFYAVDHTQVTLSLDLDEKLNIIRQGYELHILIQDDITMCRYKSDLDRLLHTLLNIFMKYDDQQFTVSRIGDVLNNKPTCRYMKNEIPYVKHAVLDDMVAEGTNIMGGAALEQLTFTYLKECAEEEDVTSLKGAAFVYFGTGNFDDSNTLVDTFKQTQKELGRTSDRVCLGIVQIGSNTGGQLLTQSLDRRSDVGNLIETLLKAEKKSPTDLAMLLLGMVDATVDTRNDKANLLDASMNIFKPDRDKMNQRLENAQTSLNKGKIQLNRTLGTVRKKFKGQDQAEP